MRRVAVFTMSMLLVAAACGDDEDGGSSLDLAGAAAGAQAAIDQGDDLGDCPFDQRAVIYAIGTAVALVPELSALGTSNGQVFRGGEVDITYCEIYPEDSTSATDGLEGFRIDAHPGMADLQQYLDEELGGDADDATTSSVLGGDVRSWCLDELRCVAAWQGDGLFVVVITHDLAAATAADATAALKAALPVVVAGLAG